MSTREGILAAAQRCLNVDPTASMAQIATAAGIGRATLHRHFDNRRVLVHEIGSRSLDRWEESLAAVGAETVGASGDPAPLRAALDDLVGRFVDDLEDFGVSLTDPMVANSPVLRERCLAIFDIEVGLYAAAQRAGVIRGDVPAVWIGHTVYGQLVAVRDALLRGDIARRDAADLMRTTLWVGIGPASGTASDTANNSRSGAANSIGPTGAEATS